MSDQINLHRVLEVSDTVHTTMAYLWAIVVVNAILFEVVLWTLRRTFCSFVRDENMLFCYFIFRSTYAPVFTTSLTLQFTFLLSSGIQASDLLINMSEWRLFSKLPQIIIG